MIPQQSFLKARLVDFGLDPQDWELNLIGRLDDLIKFEIFSRAEALIFEGWAVDGAWIFLSLPEL